MVAEAQSLKVGLSGHLRIGVAPSASTTVAALVARFWTEHPLTTVSLETKLSTEEMVRRLRAFELDAAVCYPLADTEDIVGVQVYRERPVLVASRTLLGGQPEFVTWSRAATYPLVMLDRSMRGRAVLDDAFATAGLDPAVVVETDSVATLYTLVLEGAWAGIVPDRWHWAYPPSAEIHTANLIEPIVETPVLLARLEGEPVSPLLEALESTALALSAERIAALPIGTVPHSSPLPS
jgi:DNA-binding transcriptional LysR family regulator